MTEKVLKLAHEKDIIIISSPYDTFTISRLINQSIPVKYIMKTENLVTFNTEDFTDDIQDVMIKHRHRAFPVIDKKGKCIGTISRRNFLDMHRKKVVLVDHNEKDQAVDNIDKAEIMEIIDHHKLGTLQTMQRSVSATSRLAVPARSCTRCMANRSSRFHPKLQDFSVQQSFLIP